MPAQVGSPPVVSLADFEEAAQHVSRHAYHTPLKRVGEHTFSVVQHFVDDIVTLPDRQIFDAMIWIMSHCKVVVEGAAAAPVAALLHGLIKAPAGSKVVAVLSGGNVNLDQLKNLKWN